MQAQVVDTNGGGLNFVKSGSASVSLGVAPILALASSTASSASTPSTVTVSSTNGLVVGELVPTGVVGLPTSAIITGITGATTFTVNSTVATASSSASNSAFSFPTAQVLNVASSGVPTTAANTSFNVTLPLGSQILPGMVVTQAVGTGTTAMFGGATTVLSYNSATGVATLIDTGATTANTSAANLVFAPLVAQTLAVTNTNATATLTLPSVASLAVGENVTGTGVPSKRVYHRHRWQHRHDFSRHDRGRGQRHVRRFLNGRHHEHQRDQCPDPAGRRGPQRRTGGERHGNSRQRLSPEFPARR